MRVVKCHHPNFPKPLKGNPRVYINASVSRITGNKSGLASIKELCVNLRKSIKAFKIARGFADHGGLDLSLALSEVSYINRARIELAWVKYRANLKIWPVLSGLITAALTQLVIYFAMGQLIPLFCAFPLIMGGAVGGLAFSVLRENKPEKNGLVEFKEKWIPKNSLKQIKKIFKIYLKKNHELKKSPFLIQDIAELEEVMATLIRSLEIIFCLENAENFVTQRAHLAPMKDLFNRLIQMTLNYYQK